MDKTIVIQAGGVSRRMGSDKGLALFRGEPLAARVYRRLSVLGCGFLLVTNTPESYAFTGLPAVQDVRPGLGALGGLLTALERTSTPLVGVAACDMPFVSARLFEGEFEILEREGVDAVLPDSGNGLEPFHAVYRRETCLPAVRAALDRGKSRAISWLPLVRARVMAAQEARRIEPDPRAFMNINTPGELSSAEELAGIEEKRKYQRPEDAGHLGGEME